MINNVTLVGRLTKDVDLKFTQAGKAVASFNLAVNRNFKNQSGETEADFINCVVWRKPAETLANYARKGTLLGVTGRIQTRNYENQQGQRVYVTEVVCENFQLLEKKSDGEQQNNKSYRNQQQQNQNVNSQNNFSGQQNLGNGVDPFANRKQVDIKDDDLPF